MTGILGTLRALKWWQAVILLAILVGTAGATAGAFTLMGNTGQLPLEEGEQLILVGYDDVVNQVSTSGSLVFPDRVTLTFGSQGTVGSVLVQEGDQVEAGRELARLDETAQALLRKAVAQARVDLQKAEEALAQARDPYTALDVAKSEATLASAKLSVQRAQEALDGLLNPSTAAVTSAQSQVDTAITTLAKARQDLLKGESASEDREEAAQETYDVASDGYSDVFQKYLGITLSPEDGDQDPDTLLDSWGGDLASLFNPAYRGQDIDRRWLALGPPADDPATPWSEPVVYAWLNLFPGSVVPTCTEGALPANTLCMKGEMDTAWETFQRAEEERDTMESDTAISLASDENALQRAELSLQSAQETLAALQKPPDPLEVEDKEKQLALAKAALEDAEESLAAIQEGADPLQVALSEEGVASAQQALETGLQRLEDATLRAPVAGIVSQVNVEPGQTVNANTPVMEVVDPGIIEMDGLIDEIDVLFIQEGAAASVTLDAQPGQELQGIVSSIALAARSQQGVVTYPVTILLELPPGVELPEGLTAFANIVIREERNAIVVPNQALYGTFEEPLVRLMRNGRVEEQLVVLGLSDDFWTAVRQGLLEGDQVVIEAQEATTGQFGFGGGSRGGAVFRGGSRGG